MHFIRKKIEMFSCNNLNISRNKPLLSNIGFTLLPKSILVIKGRNAVGKTTFLHTIAGFYSLQGEVQLYNIKLKKDKQTYLKNIEFLLDKPVMIEDFTVLEHLQFLGEMRDKEILIQAIIRTYALEDILDKEIKELSEGEKQRLHLSKLLLSDRKLWILDEPYVNLDEEFINIFNNVMLSYISSGGIIILTTHSNNIQNSIINAIQTIDLNDFAI